MIIANICAALLAASTLATENWVRGYVATNSTGGGVSMDWVVNYVRTCGITTAKSDYSTNTVNGIINNIILQGDLERMTHTNEGWRVIGTSDVLTNINAKVMAKVGTNEWRNAPYSMTLTTNATSASFGCASASYSTTNINGSALYFYGANNELVTAVQYQRTISDAEINAAKEGN